MPQPIALPEASTIPSMPLAPPVFSAPKWPIPPMMPPSVNDVDTPAVAPQEPIQEQLPNSKPESKNDVDSQDPSTTESTQTLPESTDLESTDIPNNVDQDFQEYVDQVTTIEIPFINKELPVPKQEIIVTAVSTATVAATASVAGTMAAKGLFEQLIRLTKPLVKTILKKVFKNNKRFTQTWARRRLESRQRIKERRRCLDES